MNKRTTKLMTGACVAFMLALGLLTEGCSMAEIRGMPTEPAKTKTLIQLQSSNKLVVTPVLTRQPYNGNIAVGNELIARVVSTTADGNYAAGTHFASGTMTFGDTSTPVAYNSSSLLSPEKAYFPGEPADPLYLTGLYPTDDWTLGSETETIATFDITGCEDVMAAKQVETNVTTVKEGTYAELEFNHLLTKLEVSLKAADAEAVARWGNVTKIVLAKANDDLPFTKVGMNMKTGVAVAPAGTQAAQAFFGMSGEAPDLAYTDDAFENATVALTTEAAKVAYSMIAPFTATQTNTDLEFNIHTEAEDESEVVTPVKVALNVDTDTAGKAFNITFLFNANKIMATADVVVWDETAEPIETPIY